MGSDAAYNQAYTALANEKIGDEEALQKAVVALAAGHPTWSWVGVYILAGDTLVLGPFAGPETEHTRIPVGTGVCGTAAERGTNMVVGDVTLIENYLACSPGTRSEMVVLIRDRGDIVGQFDVDSDEVDAFVPDDVDLLRPLAELAGLRCRRLAENLA
jgi:GAF domain-containing protein